MHVSYTHLDVYKRQLDYKILNILKENGRETASDISKAIHLSVSAVLDRIKKMEESGIIKGYTVRVDAKALGNDVTALMEISLEHPRFHDSFTCLLYTSPYLPTMSLLLRRPAPTCPGLTV